MRRRRLRSNEIAFAYSINRAFNCLDGWKLHPAEMQIQVPASLGFFWCSLQHVFRFSTAFAWPRASAPSKRPILLRFSPRRQSLDLPFPLCQWERKRRVSLVCVCFPPFRFSALSLLSLARARSARLLLIQNNTLQNLHLFTPLHTMSSAVGEKTAATVNHGAVQYRI